MSKFVNIHTHQQAIIDDPKCESVFICDPQTMDQNDRLSPYCWGLHPWSIDDPNLIDEVSFAIQLKAHKKSHFFLGLGEIGLDKRCSIAFEKQLTWFRYQINQAIENDVRLLVIHCVRSYQECFHELKNKNYQGKILIHDFRANIDLFNQYSKIWDTYISLGINTLTKKENKKKIELIPKNKLFLETDNKLDLEIEELYTTFSQLLEIDLHELKDQLFSNYTKLIES